MGCWNGTCGLTGLPIFYNDPVVAMVIQRQRAKSLETQSCYPWELWAPASLLVRSTYDDYGSIELNEPLIELLKVTQGDAARVLDLFKFEERDQPGFAMVKIPTFNIEKEGRNDIYRQNGSDFALWMAHATLFDEMRNSVRAETNDTGFKSVPLVKLSEKMAKKKRAEDKKKRKELSLVTGTAERAMAIGRASMDNPWRDNGAGVTGPTSRYLAETILQANLTDGAEAEYVSHIDEWRALHELYYMMMTLRMTLAPTGGAGSQDGDLKSYMARNKAIAAQIKRTKARWEAQ